MADKTGVDPTSPYFLSTSDNSGTVLVTCTLNGENYRTWARATKRALEAKNKVGFVDGSLKTVGCSTRLVKSIQGTVVYEEDAKTKVG